MSDAIIKQVEEQTAPLLAQAEVMAKVTDAKTEADATEFLVQVKKAYKKVEEHRLFLTKPLNDHVKAINTKFNPFKESLEGAELMVKKGMTAYRESAEFKAAEEKRQTLEQEGLLAVKEGDVQALEVIGAAHAEASALAPRIVETDSGKAHFREVTKFEIENESLIPREFLMPDEKKIKAAVNAGASIPGVRTWKEQSAVIRT